MESQDLVQDIILVGLLESGRKGGRIASGLKPVSTWLYVLALMPLYKRSHGQSSACCHENTDPIQKIRGSVGIWPTMTRAGV